MDVHIFSLRSRRQSKAWGGARQRGTPGIWRNQFQLAREAGGSFLLFALSSSLGLRQSLSPASRAGVMNRSSYLGFRAAALHPRLYAGARGRGLGFDIRISGKNLGKDMAVRPTYHQPPTTNHNPSTTIHQPQSINHQLQRMINERRSK